MNTMRIVEKAKSSSFYLWLLNVGLNRLIPFNKPHGFKIEEISDAYIKTSLPFKKRNLNHIRGMHACALATLAEFTTGFLMISRLDPDKYRLILKTLQMDYHYQAKRKTFATFRIKDDWLDLKIFQPLKTHESAVVICEIELYDDGGSHLATGQVHWQVKSWSKVKTEL